MVKVSESKDTINGNRTIINQPKIRYTDKSFEFLLKDRRKVTSMILVLAIPIINNAWRFIPEGIELPPYYDLSIFVYHFGTSFISVILTIAWFFTIPRKDYALQIISLTVLFYCLYLAYMTLPFYNETPVIFDIFASLIVFLFFFLCIRYIRNYYLDKPVDYKVLHDGLVHDIHHQRFLGDINRVEGLIQVSRMEEPYKSLCEKELNELKESVAYIAQKYSELR